MKKITIPIAMSFVLSGCSMAPYQLDSTDFVKQEETKESISSFNENYNKLNGVDSIKVDDLVSQRIIIEKGDFSEIKDKDYIDLKTEGLTFGEFVNEIASMKKMGVVFNVPPEVLTMPIVIDFKGIPTRDMFRSLERIMDVDIAIHANTIYVTDTIAIQGVFSAIQTENMAIYKNLKEHLAKILGEKSNIVIDEATGAYMIEARANLIRKTKDLIESVINESSNRALVRMDIYKVDNIRAKELGISFDSMIDSLYQINNGAKIDNSILSAALSYATYKGVDAVGKPALNSNLLFSIKALEKAQVLTYVSSPSLMLSNGIEAKLDDTREVGDWLPGGYYNNNTYGVGYSSNNSTQNRPQFEKFEVGNIIKLNPKINQQEKILHLRIDFEDSKVYDIKSTTYQSNQNTPSVTVTKSLKAKNHINTIATLSENKYSIISGMRQQQSEIERQNIPGSQDSAFQAIGSNKNNNEFHDVLMLARSYFPENVKYVEVHNKKPFQ
jgi:hypothetical protein